MTAGVARVQARAARRREHYVARTRGGSPRGRVAAALDYLRQEMAHHQPAAAAAAADRAVAFLVDCTDRLQRGEFLDSYRR